MHYIFFPFLRCYPPLPKPLMGVIVLTTDEFRSDSMKMFKGEKPKYWDKKRKYSPSVTRTRGFNPGLCSYTPATGSLNPDNDCKFK